MGDVMQWLLSLLIGLGLSATCGFRVFVPLLGMSIACKTGHLSLCTGFDWIGSWPALTAFTVAAVFEVGGYYIPWVDNLLDTVATPAAVVAGIIITASMVQDISPFLKWVLAIIAGGGSAGVVQSGTVLLRGGSTAGTGGLGNPIVATLELVASFIGTVLSIVIPIIAACAFIIFVIIVTRWAWRNSFRTSESSFEC